MYGRAALSFLLFFIIIINFHIILLYIMLVEMMHIQKLSTIKRLYYNFVKYCNLNNRAYS